ncbi:MAG: HIT family protein [Phycisphaeraceae bacterium]|nr:HIT family protein [Phycisphaeraceae bacterium]MBX3407299.1 HIT family protein [Phycisphaeraceae bacterium]
MGHEASRLATCPLCARLDDPTAALRVCELRESVVFLHEHQRYEGWCVLVLKDHAVHLAALPMPRQVRLWEDVSQVASAITRAFAPARINYECLGNVVGHVHWHVIPRYTEPADPDPRATVWVRPAAERDCGVSVDRAAELIGKLRGAGLG